MTVGTEPKIDVDYIVSQAKYVTGSSDQGVMLLDAAFGQIPQVGQKILLALDGFDDLNGLYVVVDLLPDMAILERQDHVFEVNACYQATQASSFDREAIVNAVMYKIPRFTIKTIYHKETSDISGVTLAELAGEPGSGLEWTESKDPESTNDVVVDIPPLDKGLSGLARAYEHIRCVVM